MGEAVNLVNNSKVEKIIFNSGEFKKKEKELIKLLDKKKILMILITKLAKSSKKQLKK